MILKNKFIYFKNPYIVTVLLITVGALLRIWPLNDLGSSLAWLTFYPVVITAALFGGIYAGLFGTFLTCFIIYFLWFLINDKPFIQNPTDWLGMIVFIINCSYISVIIEAGRRSNKKVKQANEKIIKLNEELESIVNERTAALSLTNDNLRNEIAERKFVEENLHTTRNRYIKTLDNMMEGCQLIGFDWCYIYINKTADLHNRQSSEKLIGKRYMDMWPGIEETEVFLLIKKCLEERSFHHLENEFIYPDGSKGWFDLNINPDTEGVLILSQDISERKRAEQMLHLQSAALNAAANAIVLTDINGIIEWVNPAFITLTGYNSVEAIGKNPREIIKSGNHDLNYYQDLWDMILAGKIWRGEMINRRKDGTFYTEEQTITPLLDEFGKITHFISIKEDITKRKHSENQIIKLNEELEKRIEERTAQLESTNKELEAFTYSVSHDLRAPLRAINGYANIFEEDYSGKLDDESKRLLNVIQQNAKKMGNLIDDLLSFSRLGKMGIKKSNINMNELVRGIFDELKKTFNYSTELKIDNTIDIKADSALMNQVIINLLSNALKYSVNSQKPIIEINSYIDKNKVVFSIKDNGVGFNMKYYDKLFGVFQRLHSSSEFEGTGVGLAIVKRIIIKHGGEVWAESILNVGSTFYFSLPVE
jgi:PAS domain S-box-containing protein